MLNEKISKRKIEMIMKIMNEDGGTTLFEATGLLDYVKYLLYKQAEVMQGQANAKMMELYKQSKDSRLNTLRRGE